MRANDSTRRVTLQDISDATGYSVNTVSRSLRDKDDIAKGTRTYIQQTAKRMGYTVNQIASSLRSGKTNTLALILGGMHNPFYGLMADMIQDAVAAYGYSLLIMCSRDNPDLELRLTENAISRHVDGVLLFPSNDPSRSMERLTEMRIPFVLMSRCLRQGAADSVLCDEEQGAYLAARHLIRKNRMKLAFISSGSVVFATEQRLHGFHRACDEAGIPADDRVEYIADLDAKSRLTLQDWHSELTKKLCEFKNAGINGLFVFCDVEAWHVLTAIQHVPDLRPDDFGIIGFDNIGDSLSFPIPLCSVDCALPEMARRGVELLMTRIDGDPRPPQTIVCPVHLVCRESCNGLYKR